MTKAHRSLNLLRRNLSGCSSETKEKAYTTLVRPVLEYAGAVWDPYQANHISKLESVQCKTARFVRADYSRYSDVTRMMDNLGWRTLQERRFVSRMSLFYCAAHQPTACIIPPYIATTQPRTRTSHNLQYIPPQAHTDVYKFSFFPRCVRTWNILPSTIVKAFKAALNNSFTESWKHVYGSPKRHPAASAAKQYRLHCCPGAHVLVSKSNFTVHNLFFYFGF